MQKKEFKTFILTLLNSQKMKTLSSKSFYPKLTSKLTAFITMRKAPSLMPNQSFQRLWMTNNSMTKAYQLSNKETFFSKKKRSLTTPLKNQLKSSYFSSQVTHPQIINGLCSEMYKRSRTEKSTQSRSFHQKMKENILMNTTCTCL